jgi:hypothetical protein
VAEHDDYPERLQAQREAAERRLEHLRDEAIERMVGRLAEVDRRPADWYRTAARLREAREVVDGLRE